MKARSSSALLAPILLLSLFGTTATLAGCGGGGGGGSTDGGVIAIPVGRVKVDVAWPKASREIPTNARSVKIEAKDGVLTVGSALIVFPATTAMLTDVPCGDLTLHATAYASTDGTGTPLAVADSPVTVTDGGTSTVALTLASTIDHLEYEPNPFIIGAGGSLPLVVTAKNLAGQSVMIDPSSLTFSSSNPALFTIAADGKVTAGTGLGIGTITVTESSSHKSLTIAAQVAVGISISSPATTLNVNGSTLFSAAIVGSSNQGVTWSVREPSGGTISPSGLYSAPTHRGIYHVDGTSVADPTRKATATLTVTAGSINAEVK